jgi:polyisoprenoid-binding protein YceI
MTDTAVHPFTGSFAADPAHSSFQAQLRHMGVGSFRTGFDDVEARLEIGPDGPRLTGRSSALTSSRVMTSSTLATTLSSRSSRAASSSPTTARSPSPVA